MSFSVSEVRKCPHGDPWSVQWQEVSCGNAFDRACPPNYECVKNSVKGWAVCCSLATPGMAGPTGSSPGMAGPTGSSPGTSSTAPTGNPIG